HAAHLDLHSFPTRRSSDLWADRYDEGSTDVAADVAFYVGLAREADGPLVELAVGTGRVAIPVAQATGKRVVGIDSSSAMLAQARDRKSTRLNSSHLVISYA